MWKGVLMCHFIKLSNNFLMIGVNAMGQWPFREATSDSFWTGIMVVVLRQVGSERCLCPLYVHQDALQLFCAFPQGCCQVLSELVDKVFLMSCCQTGLPSSPSECLLQAALQAISNAQTSPVKHEFWLTRGLMVVVTFTTLMHLLM